MNEEKNYQVRFSFAPDQRQAFNMIGSLRMVRTVVWHALAIDHAHSVSAAIFELVERPDFTSITLNFQSMCLSIKRVELILVGEQTNHETQLQEAQLQIPQYSPAV